MILCMEWWSDLAQQRYFIGKMKDLMKRAKSKSLVVMYTWGDNLESWRTWVGDQFSHCFILDLLMKYCRTTLNVEKIFDLTKLHRQILTMRRMSPHIHLILPSGYLLELKLQEDVKISANVQCLKSVTKLLQSFRNEKIDSSGYQSKGKEDVHKNTDKPDTYWILLQLQCISHWLEGTDLHFT